MLAEVLSNNRANERRNELMLRLRFSINKDVKPARKT